MAKVYDSILELIGHTPLVRLHRIEEQENIEAHLIAKLESFNPGSSIKDRIALNMIEAAEREGKLLPGGTIIEGTSGNTGIGIAMVGAAKGYKTIICMPENMSHERVQILQGYGAEVYLTPAALNMAGAGKQSAELQAQISNSIVLGQGMNPNNPNAHFNSTGPEIWEDLDGQVDIVVAAVGTGGTLTGVGEFLRSKNPNVELIGVEPAGCPVLSGGEPGPHKIQGIGGGMIAPVTKLELFNEIITITDDDAYETSRYSALQEGISIGISSGAALSAAIQVAKREENKGKNIVVIFADSGERYLSSGLYGE
ncbi:MAG: cysteine synthase A [Bacillota bacterium]|nr:cysteine synthase A [Bacillota bacterium]